MGAAAAFPDRPIKFILGFGTGGPTDIVARTLAEQLSKDLGEPVIVENKTGASGNIATEAVANADADGYTYLIAANPLAVNETLFPDFAVKFSRDLTTIAPISTSVNVLSVGPSLRVQTLADFIARARQATNAVTYATVGIGSSSHLAGVLFDMRVGTKMLPVVYHGGDDALKDLLGGRVDAWFAPIPSVLGSIQAGQLTALATTGPTRAPSFPQVPTLAELGVAGYDVQLWTGLFARKGVPAEAVQTMRNAVAHALGSSETRTALERIAIAPSAMTPTPSTRSCWKKSIVRKPR